MDVTLSPKCQTAASNEEAGLGESSIRDTAFVFVWKAGGMDVHISQIPGLAPTIETEDRVRGRRSRIHDSDSDYIKLAKQGGHKGLLWHEDTFVAKASSYKPPDWFCATPQPDSTTWERESSRPFFPLQSPFGNDSMSAWERGNTASEMNNSALPSREPAGLQTSSNDLTTKYKRVTFNKNLSPPEMSKLLSHGYAEKDEARVKTK